MCFQGIKPEMKGLFPENIFKRYKVDQKTEHHVEPPADSIPEGLEVHDLAERRVKKINERQHKAGSAMNMFLHGGVKILQVCGLTITDSDSV